jgi:hypothetical protein
LSLMLKRVIEVLVALVLVVAMVTVLPAVAEAQGMAAPQDAQSVNRSTEAARSMVVRPGDCLWSISSERLGPNATSRQIASDVERIYALNRDRIGADPDLIFAGQKLLLPPVARATPARNTAEPAEASPKGRGLKSEWERAPSTTVGTAGSQAGRAPDPMAEPVALPDMPTKQVPPKVSSPSATDTPSPVESFGRTARSLLSSATSAIVGLFPQDDLLKRKLFGFGIIVLTLSVGGLMAWKLPLKRNVVGGYEVWGISKGYIGGYTPHLKATDHYRGTPELAPAGAEPEWESVDGEAPAVKNGANSAGMIVAARRRRERILRQQARGSRRSPHGILATGAHHPQVTRLLRHAQTTAPWWALARSPRLRQGSSPRNEGDCDGRRESLRGDSRTDAAAGVITRKEVGSRRS